MSNGVRDSTAFFRDDIDNLDITPLGMDIVKNILPRRKNKKSRRKVHKSSRKKSFKRRAGKPRSSSKGIMHTKNGQPYRIMANGRARFIKRRR